MPAGDSSACSSPPPDRDATERRGPREPATTRRSDRIHRMGRTHRGSADRSGMPHTCPAPAAGGARPSCRPSRDGAPQALGTPEVHRSGEPGASRLGARKRCRGRRAGPPHTGAPQPLQSCLHVGRGHRRTFTGSRSTVSSCTWLRCSTTPGSRARCPTSTSRFAAPRWHASSPTATTCLPITASSSQTRSPCATPPASASNPVPRPTSCLPAQPSMCSACAATRYPMQSASASSRSTRGWASSGSSPGFSEPRPRTSHVAAPGTCTASP